MIIQTVQPEQGTESAALPLQAPPCPTCSMVSSLPEATAVQGTAQILHFISQHISRREHLQALLGAPCQLGQGQHVDTKDLEKGEDAGPAQLDCKVHTGNLDTTGKDQTASVLHLLE